MANEKSVGAVIFRESQDGRQFLVLRYERINDAKGEHTYLDFPKGHVEEGESEKDTLKREIREETGIDNLRIIDDFREKIKYFFRADGKLINKEVVYFLSETSTDDVKISEEHIGFEWLSYDEALEKLGFDNSKNVLKKAKEFLSHRKTLKDWS